MRLKILVLIILFLAPGVCLGIEQADMVLVIKSKSKLFLKKDGNVIKEYNVSFGANPRGPKLEKGDERTPEGVYILDYKNPDSDFYKSIHISYPNAADRKRARKLGIKPGGGIMIHGQKDDFGKLSTVIRRYNLNWTDGCIAVSNSAMDEIWQAVAPGTLIEIRP